MSHNRLAQVLNAKPESIAREAEIIAQAGRRVTAKSLKEMALSKSLVR